MLPAGVCWMTNQELPLQMGLDWVVCTVKPADFRVVDNRDPRPG